LQEAGTEVLPMKRSPTLFLMLAASLWAGARALAEPPGATLVERSVRDGEAGYRQLASEIWSLAELGYLETRSTALLQDALSAEGFSIESPIAGLPTAFMASYGSGEPVIAMLAEFDALPGVSQQALPERAPREGVTAGHACGHHLFGTGSVAAAIAARRWLEAHGGSGTVRLYGTPAEEGGSGKVYMVREGLFDDVDAVIHWHPSDVNQATPGTTTANRSARFRFRGRAAHAAAAPERGRSALDGVEAMNMMVNLLREHVPASSRIHYVITRGGEAPNVVPENAEVYYYVRAPEPDGVRAIWSRVEAAARGAAMGTGTEVSWEIIHGNYNILPNVTLARVMHANLEHFGGLYYDDAEQAFAERLSRSFQATPSRTLGSQEQVMPFSEQITAKAGSSDVGDVSWMTPTVGLSTATWVPGTPAHSWQAVAAGGTSIGHKGMLLAAKTMGLTAVTLLQDPALVAAAREEWQQRRGKDMDYQPLLGDRPPPLDYRVR
jgi:aminobenzoyl-glutamate utilization protein B